MKKNLTKKLMLSVLTLAFAVVSLGASTFAWFTLSKDAEVKQFSGQVTAGAGLELQVLKSGTAPVEANWQTSTITSDQIKAIIGENVVLTAVTPGFVTGTKNIDQDENGLLKFCANDNSTVKTSGWIQFDLAFRLSDTSGTTEMGLYFDGYTLTTTNSKPWRVNAVYNGKDNVQQTLHSTPTYYVSDAARLGIKVQNGGLFTTPADKFFEAPSTSGSTQYTSGIPLNDVDTNYNAAVNYYNKVNENNPAAQLSLANANKYEVASSVGADANGWQIGSLETNQIVQITVAVWIEGWDGECLNAIFAQTLNATLSFYLNVPDLA